MLILYVDVKIQIKKLWIYNFGAWMQWCYKLKTRDLKFSTFKTEIFLSNYLVIIYTADYLNHLMWMSCFATPIYYRRLIGIGY